MKRRMTMLVLACAIAGPSVAEGTADWAGRLTFSGVVEIEESYTDSVEWGDNESSRDLILATAQLGVDAAPSFSQIDLEYDVLGHQPRNILTIRQY